MPGVTKNIYSETGCNQFYNCMSLEVVVFGASFETDCQYFIFDAETCANWQSESEVEFIKIPFEYVVMG